MRISILRPASGRVSLLLLLPLFLGMGGCDRLRPKPPAEFVYVVSKQTFLRERVAPVSSRVGVVNNGQQLRVLEHGRRFLMVKTEKGETGWIEERAVIPADVYAQFVSLKKDHANDPVVATAVLRDDLYLHVKPGRDTDRFYLLPENDKLQMLVRASVPKATPPQGSLPLPRPSTGTGAKPGSKAAKPGANHAVAKVTDVAAHTTSAVGPAVEGEAPALEDWWLVRDSDGHVGWLLSRRMDVDVPDAIAGYGEGQRIVGAYLLTTVTDSESDLPNKQVPEYVAVLNAYKDGLPYDFDQVRVFTWNLKKHRYETAYRQRKLQGYLPVKVSRQTFDKLGEEPVFEFKQGVGDGVTMDPATGATRPAQTENVQFRLEGVQVKKVGPAPPPVAASPETKPETRSASHRAAREKHRKAHKGRR